MITFTQWAENENKDLNVGTIEEKQARTVASFPGGKAYPPQMGGPQGKGKKSRYPDANYVPVSATGALSATL